MTDNVDVQKCIHQKRMKLYKMERFEIINKTVIVNGIHYNANICSMGGAKK